MAGRIKKNVLHFPKEDAMIVKLLMEHGSDVMAQTKEVYFLKYYCYFLEFPFTRKIIIIFETDMLKFDEIFHTYFLKK